METRRTTRATMKRDRSTNDSTSMDDDPKDLPSRESTESNVRLTTDMAFSFSMTTVDHTKWLPMRTWQRPRRAEIKSKSSSKKL